MKNLRHSKRHAEAKCLVLATACSTGHYQRTRVQEFDSHWCSKDFSNIFKINSRGRELEKDLLISRRVRDNEWEMIRVAGMLESDEGNNLMWVCVSNRIYFLKLASTGIKGIKKGTQCLEFLLD